MPDTTPQQSQSPEATPPVAAAQLDRIADLLVQILDRLPDREAPQERSTGTVDVDGT